MSGKHRPRSRRRELHVKYLDINPCQPRAQLAATRTGKQISLADILLSHPSILAHPAGPRPGP